MHHFKKLISKLNKKEKILLFSIPIIVCTIISLFMYLNLSKNSFDKSSSGSTYLKNITIDNHKIKFNKKKYEYTVFLSENETSLNIYAEPVDKSANVKIVNNDDITSHDKVYIYVTSKDHKVRKYTINYNFRESYYYYSKNIDNCDLIESNYCIKFFNVNDSEYKQSLLFTYDYLNNGYPNTNYITINDHKVFEKKLVNGQFKNIKIFDNNVVLTYNNKNDSKLNLISFNTKGVNNFDYEIIDEELKNIFIYNINYQKDSIKLKTRMKDLSKKNLCKLNDEDIIEVRYIIDYKNNKFSEPKKLNQLTNLEYKILMNIKC